MQWARYQNSSNRVNTMLSNLLRTIKKFPKRLSNSTGARLDGLPRIGFTRAIVWAAAGLILVSLVYLAQSSNAALIARNLRIKQLRLEEVQRENAQLRYEIAAATSPSSIDQRARKLGLAPAKNVVYGNMPALRVDLADVMPAFAPKINPPDKTAPPSTDSLWQQLAALFGFSGASDRVQAKTK